MKRRLTFNLLVFFMLLCAAMPAHAAPHGAAEALVAKGSAEPVGPAPQNLPLRLIGTAASGVQGKSLAVIMNKATGMARICREGDDLYGATVKQILREAVILETGGGDVLLSALGGGRGAPPGPATEVASLPQRDIEAAVPDYMSLVRSIRARPFLDSGRPGGVLVYNIDPDSVFARMGLADGDVIQSVNGKPLTSTLDMKTFYEDIKKTGTVSLAIRRGESREALQFRIQ